MSERTTTLAVVNIDMCLLLDMCLFLFSISFIIFTVSYMIHGFPMVVIMSGKSFNSLSNIIIVKFQYKWPQTRNKYKIYISAYVKSHHRNDIRFTKIKTSLQTISASLISRKNESLIFNITRDNAKYTLNIQ
jgi:hypothetical protein